MGTTTDPQKAHRPCVMVWLAAVALTAGLWVRSYIRTDEVVVASPRGPNTYVAASHSGYLLALRVCLGGEMDGRARFESRPCRDLDRIGGYPSWSGIVAYRSSYQANLEDSDTSCRPCIVVGAAYWLLMTIFIAAAVAARAWAWWKGLNNTLPL